MRTSNLCVFVIWTSQCRTLWGTYSLARKGDSQSSSKTRGAHHLARWSDIRIVSGNFTIAKLVTVQIGNAVLAHVAQISNSSRSSIWKSTRSTTWGKLQSKNLLEPSQNLITPTTMPSQSYLQSYLPVELEVPVTRNLYKGKRFTQDMARFITRSTNYVKILCWSYTGRAQRKSRRSSSAFQHGKCNQVIKGDGKGVLSQDVSPWGHEICSLRSTASRIAKQ